LSIRKENALTATDENHQRGQVNAKYGHSRRLLNDLFDFDKSIRILPIKLI